MLAGPSEPESKGKTCIEDTDEGEEDCPIYSTSEMEILHPARFINTSTTGPINYPSRVPPPPPTSHAETFLAHPSVHIFSWRDKSSFSLCLMMFFSSFLSSPLSFANPREGWTAERWSMDGRMGGWMDGWTDEARILWSFREMYLRLWKFGEKRGNSGMGAIFDLTRFL